MGKGTGVSFRILAGVLILTLIRVPGAFSGAVVPGTAGAYQPDDTGLHPIITDPCLMSTAVLNSPAKNLTGMDFGDVLYGIRPCGREKIFTDFKPEDCEDPMKKREVEDYSQRCNLAGRRWDENGPLLKILRRIQWMQFFNREKQLLSRYSPGEPGFERRWMDFEAKWKKRLADHPEIAAVDLDAMRWSSNDSITGQLGHLPVEIKELKDRDNEVIAETGVPFQTIYSLFRSAILLQAYDSPVGQKWAEKKTGGKGVFADILLKTEKDYIFSYYPGGFG